MKKNLQNIMRFCIFFEKGILLSEIVAPKNGLEWALSGQVFVTMICSGDILFVHSIILVI